MSSSQHIKHAGSHAGVIACVSAPLLLLLTLLLIGCTMPWQNGETPVKIITFHELTSNTRDTDRFVLVLSGRDGEDDIWLRKIPVMHSKYIEAMEVVTGPRGMVGLKCHLNQHGKYL